VQLRVVERAFRKMRRVPGGVDMVRVVDGLLVEHWAYAAPLPSGE
jgi:hypothetical protein